MSDEMWRYVKRWSVALVMLLGVAFFVLAGFAIWTPNPELEENLWLTSAAPLSGVFLILMGVSIHDDERSKRVI